MARVLDGHEGQSMGPAAVTAPAGPIGVRDVLGIFKPRIAVSIMLSAIGGLAITPGPLPQGWRTGVMALAVFLAAGAAGAFNQWAERDLDANMARHLRTAFCERPAPRGCGLACHDRRVACFRRHRRGSPPERLDKGDLAIRPIHHQREGRVEAHVFIAFLAYCLHVTLGRQLEALAPGLTARSALEKFAAVQMVDVHIPTTDGRELCLTRHTQPEPELALLLDRLKLALPPQPPPKISAAQIPAAAPL